MRTNAERATEHGRRENESCEPLAHYCDDYIERLR
jgi:hypothetical protein